MDPLTKYDVNYYHALKSLKVVHTSDVKSIRSVYLHHIMEIGNRVENQQVKDILRRFNGLLANTNSKKKWKYKYFSYHILNKFITLERLYDSTYLPPIINNSWNPDEIEWLDNYVTTKTNQTCFKSEMQDPVATICVLLTWIGLKFKDDVEFQMINDRVIEMYKYILDN